MYVIMNPLYVFMIEMCLCIATLSMHIKLINFQTEMGLCSLPSIMTPHPDNSLGSHSECGN